MTYLGKGSIARATPQYNGVHDKWVMRENIFLYQTSVYTTWGNVAGGINWAQMLGGSNLSIKYGSTAVAFGPPGTIIPIDSDIAGNRIRVQVTFTPEWSAALTAPDVIHACIAQTSEGFVGTTTPEPESTITEATATAVPGKPMTLQRELVWDGSPLTVLTRHVDVTNIAQNIQSDNFNMSVEVLG